MSDAQSLRASYFVKAQDVAEKHDRWSEIPKSNFGSETDAARAAQSRRVRETHRQRRLWLYARPIPVAGQVNRHWSQLKVSSYVAPFHGGV